MADEPQRRIRARLEVETADLIHNELTGAAFYFRERVAERIAAGDHDGIFFEMIAGLTMSAFSLEACLNYVGDAKIGDWKEFARTADKLALICEKLGVTRDTSQRPHSTISPLIELRNLMAHGKPKVVVKVEEAEGTHDELVARVRAIQTEWWETMVTPEFVSIAFDDVEAIWLEMLKAADIDIIETMRGGGSSIHFLGYLE